MDNVFAIAAALAALTPDQARELAGAINGAVANAAGTVGAMLTACADAPAVTPLTMLVIKVEGEGLIKVIKVIKTVTGWRLKRCKAAVDRANERGDSEIRIPFAAGVPAATQHSCLNWVAYASGYGHLLARQEVSAELAMLDFEIPGDLAEYHRIRKEREMEEIKRQNAENNRRIREENAAAELARVAEAVNVIELIANMPEGDPN